MPHHSLANLEQLTRRQMLLIPAAALAQTRFPGVAYPDYPACLPEYIRGLAVASRRRRLTALGRLTSRGAIQPRQVWVRENLLRLVGELPAKTPLHARTTGALEYASYRVEKVVYESRPGFHVSANLYIPKRGSAPFPGVLFQLGHSLNGKAYASYQSACQGLVQLGFVVLAFDPMGQGERVYYPEAAGVDSKFHDADAEHTTPGRQMLLVGSTCTQFQLWDAIRSLDYLAAHPLVDPRRLASTGQSGGATLTMLLAAVDDRLRCAAEFSGNTENIAARNFLPPGATDDAEQNLVGAGPSGFDRWDLFYPFAPKPMLISISDKDSFGTYSPNYVSDSWEEYQRLAGVYRTLGSGQNIAWHDTPLPHGLSLDSRIRLYNWMRLHLQDEPVPVTEEPPVTLETDERLRVSESGNVLRSFRGETPFSIIKKQYRELRPTRSSTGLERLLQVDPTTPARPAILRQVRSPGGTTISALDISSSAGVHVPCWLFENTRSHAMSPILLMLHPRGRNADWGEAGICQSLARQGYTVCAADVRGIGDLSPQVSPGAPGYSVAHQSEEDYAWASLILGRPLIGQRVTDILAVARALQISSGKNRAVAVAAFGILTPPALFAAALEPSLTSLYLAGGLSSYAALVEEEDYRHPLANFVPSILKQIDLPDVVAGLAPRKVVIAGAVDGKAATLSLDAARIVYRTALAGKNVTLKETPDWNLEVLGGLFASPKNA